MADLLFYAFAGLTAGSALMLVLSRNAVNGVMWMILCFLGTAALFATLEAFFLAIVQVLVYAGAIIVLFLFIIMLLNADQPSRLRPSPVALAFGTSALALLLIGVATLFIIQPHPADAPALIDPAPASVTRHLALEMFTRFLLPIQVTGFLLLLAMVGVIHISRRSSPAVPGPALAPSHPARPASSESP